MLPSGPRFVTPITTVDWTETGIRDNFPVLTGAVFVGAPYVVGAGIVAFAPPVFKPLGLAMLVPSPMDAVYFGAGYAVGSWIVDDIPPWLI